MKYIVLIIGLLAVGCGKTEEDKVVGEYELKGAEGTVAKYVLLENGIAESYANGKKTVENKYKIVDGEIHILHEYSKLIAIHRINQDKSITWIAAMYEDERRKDFQKEDQWTFKKIK